MKNLTLEQVKNLWSTHCASFEIDYDGYLWVYVTLGAGKALSKYIVSSLDEEEMETFCKYLRKIGCASSSDHAEIALQDVCFTCPDQIVGAWYKAQRDTDLFHLPRGFGHRKSEVISNG